MIGLLSAVFNISVCVGFPMTVFIVLLAKSKKLKTELKIFIVGICTSSSSNQRKEAVHTTLFYTKRNAGQSQSA